MNPRKIYITIQTNRRHQFNLWNAKSKTFISKKTSNIVLSQLETNSKMKYDGHEIVVAGMAETPTHFGATLGSFDRIVKEMSEAAELDVNVKRERKENKKQKRKQSFRKTMSSFSAKSKSINRKNLKRSFSWMVCGGAKVEWLSF